MEFVHDLDTKYTKEPVPCPNEDRAVTLKQSQTTRSLHGNLVVHGSGAFLVCGLCGYQQPIARP